MRRAPLTAVLATSALLALSACGGQGSSSADAPPTSATSAAPVKDVDALVQAAATKSTVGSSKIAFTSRTQLGAQDVSVTGAGAYDHAAQRGTFSFGVPSRTGGSAGTIEERLIGPDLFLALPSDPGVFYKLSAGDLGGTSLASTSNPASSLEVLKVLTGVQAKGSEQVRGVATRRYEGTLDVKNALARSQGSAKQLLQNSLAKLPVQQIPVVVNIDEQDRVVKFTQQVDLPSGLKSTTTVENYDFGTPVQVTAPPASAVRDGGPLLQALKNQAGRGSAAPSPSPS